MRFHVYLPTYWDHYGSGSMTSAVAAAASTASDLGYEGLWANDKLLIGAEERGVALAEQLLEPLVTLASLVHLVPDLNLGTAVIVLPSRDPILLAKQATALHLLSGGRFILGVGIGDRPAELAALGRSFSRRARATDEAIEVMQTLWREPEASYHGEFFDFEGVAQQPHPLDGGPPIWVGGNSPGAVRRAARYGSGWLPFVTEYNPFVNSLESFRSQVALLRELTVGRQCPSAANMFYLRLRRPDEAKTVHSTTRGMPPAIAGSVDAITEHLSGYQDAGLDDAVLIFESESVEDLLRQMEVFAEGVAPRLASTG